MKFVGIDSGSTMCKAVLYCGSSIIDTFVTKTGWDPGRSAEESLGVLLERNSVRKDEALVSATGYGRGAVDFADFTFTEITCHAYGAMLIAPDIQGVIDIGGQDSKVIQIQNGRVTNFIMNDKCAAGTGRFLSMACDTLGAQLELIDEFADLSGVISVNSMCAVFAESEIIGLLAMQKNRRQIMTGVLHSIAQKIRQMTGKVAFTGNEPLLMTGGLSKSKALMEIIAQEAGVELITHELALFAGAIGACVCAERKKVLEAGV